MKVFFISTLLLVVTFGSVAYAQEKPNDGKESFYRAVKSSDLITLLPPREGSGGSNLFGESFFTGTGGCPDEINIGSVTDGTPVFGGIDIELFLDSDITIICN